MFFSILEKCQMLGVSLLFIAFNMLKHGTSFISVDGMPINW